MNASRRVSLRSRVATSIALGAFVAAGTGARAGGVDVDRLIARTPQIERTSDPVIADDETPVYRIRGTAIDGVVRGTTVLTGTLRDGQSVIVVPLLATQSRPAVYNLLLWTKYAGRTRFVGVIPSKDGWELARMRDNTLLVMTELFDHYQYDENKDSWLVETFTIEGVRLRRLSKKIVPALACC